MLILTQLVTHHDTFASGVMSAYLLLSVLFKVQASVVLGLSGGILQLSESRYSHTEPMVEHDMGISAVRIQPHHLMYLHHY